MGFGSGAEMPLICRNTRAPQSSELDLCSTGLRAGLAELRLGWDRLFLHQHTSNTLRSSWEQLQLPQTLNPLLSLLCEFARSS